MNTAAYYSEEKGGEEEEKEKEKGREEASRLTSGTCRTDSIGMLGQVVYVCIAITMCGISCR